MTEDEVVVTSSDKELLGWMLDELDIDILERQRERVLKQFARVRQRAESRGRAAVSIDVPALKRAEEALALSIKTVARRQNSLRVLLYDDDGAQSRD